MKRIAVIAAKNNSQALEKKNLLVEKYGFTDLTTEHKDVSNIDLVVAIGGDGLMFHPGWMNARGWDTKVTDGFLSYEYLLNGTHSLWNLIILIDKKSEWARLGLCFRNF